MNIFVDENIPLMTVRALREAGHDVLDIRGTADQGMKDPPLWEMAQAAGRLLITTDKGFAQRRDERHHGLLIVRLRQPNRQKIHERVLRAMGDVPESEWRGLTVVMRDAVQSVWRVREDDPASS
jgi:predicted nuclease of predicted toxin-antitoxin system